MQKIIPSAFFRCKLGLHRLALGLGCALVSSAALANGDMPLASIGSAVILALAACLLLLLDGMKRQFEVRAFFGTLAGVAAGLMLSGVLFGFNGGVSSGDYFVATDAATAAVVVAPDAAADAADPVKKSEPPGQLQASSLQLQLGDIRSNGDVGLALPGTSAFVKVSCQENISVHLYSAQALPKSLSVRIVAPNLEPSTRLAEDTIDTVEPNGFERIFNMNTRCDLMDNAKIEVVSLRAASDTLIPHESDKITVQISRF